jgi:hypothetical protein
MTVPDVRLDPKNDFIVEHLEGGRRISIDDLIEFANAAEFFNSLLAAMQAL